MGAAPIGERHNDHLGDSSSFLPPKVTGDEYGTVYVDDCAGLPGARVAPDLDES